MPDLVTICIDNLENINSLSYKDFKILTLYCTLEILKIINSVIIFMRKFFMRKVLRIGKTLSEFGFYLEVQILSLAANTISCFS